MSSLRRSAKSGSRTHRERPQPENRAHLGLLEKKKDYVLRARDYSKKKKKLKILRRKALNRNPDEFHFHMVRSQVRDGEHHDLTPEPDEDTIVQKKLSNMNDLKYVKHRLNVENKKIEKLKATLHLVDVDCIENTHIIFVDDDDEAKKFDPVKYFNTKEEVLDRKFNRPSVSDLGKQALLSNVSKQDVLAADAERRVRYNELLKRLERAKELKVVVEKLEMRKNLAESKGKELKPKLVARGGPMKARIYEWTYERKK